MSDILLETQNITIGLIEATGGGDVGPIGPQGLQGIQGPAGPAGAQGLPGIQGPAGAQGATGPQGPAGATGAQGLQGIQGPAGAQGATGAQGPAGATGYTPNFITGSGVPSSGTGNNGDLYLNSSTGDLYGPKSSGSWGSIVANIKGATGAQGPTGATGAQGPTGTVSGGSIIDLTSGQIAFPATQIASSGVKTLDDYEEGSWTPAVNIANATTGITYNTQEGRYIKIGTLVYASFSITLTSKGSLTGQVRIVGLPFSGSGAITNSGMACFGYLSGLSITGELIGYYIYGQSGVLLYAQSSGASTALQDTNITNGTTLTGTLVFRAAN